MEKQLLNEEEVLQRLSVAMDLLGFNTEIVELPDYPLSIESKVPGYEDTQLNLCLIFMPAQDILDNQSQVLQVYFALNDGEVGADLFAILHELCNSLNMSCINGVFGVQESIGKACYKQGVVIPLGTPLDTALNMIMQNLLLMALNLDSVYNKFTALLGK